MISRSRTKANINYIHIPDTPEMRSHPDENFYEDEVQLMAGLDNPLPEGLEPAPLPEFDPDDFEKIYMWFLA